MAVMAKNTTVIFALPNADSTKLFKKRPPSTPGIVASISNQPNLASGVLNGFFIKQSRDPTREDRP